MGTNTAEKSWDTLTPDEKLERRFDVWNAAEGINFTSKQAEEAYKARTKRFTDAMLLKKPDRVPISIHFGEFIIGYYGYTEQEVMYDAEKAADVTLRGTLEFQTDGKIAVEGGIPGRVFDILNYKLFNWPGHGVGENAGWQFKEAEYMMADEYDDFIRDPSDYWTRVHMPRIMGVAEPLSQLVPAVYMIEYQHVVTNISRYGLPEVQETLEAFMKAGHEALAWQEKLGVVNRKLDEMGYPSPAGGFCYAPFDFLGDTLRGTRGIIMDMYRQPGKLQEALERSIAIMIKWGSSTRLGACPIVGMPLHKGADGFMSDEHFERFYWPSLLEVIRGLNSEGLIPRLFAEGGYNTRLETIRKDLDKCKTIWHFDHTDMARAKEIIGDVACLMGNVHASLLQAGTEEEVTACCKELIETAGKDGGYILATGVGISRSTKVENVRAMINAAREYGSYL
jgi:uroporphyrinogen-III decarboxylase